MMYIKGQTNDMDLFDLIYWIIVGAIAGWLAGKIMAGRGFGFMGNVIVGIIGAILGGFVLGHLGLSFGSGLIGTILNAVIGAVIFIFAVGLIKKK